MVRLDGRQGAVLLCRKRPLFLWFTAVGFLWHTWRTGSCSQRLESYSIDLDDPPQDVNCVTAAGRESITMTTEYSLVMLVEETDSDFVPYLLDLHNYLTKIGISHELLLMINGSDHYIQQCLQNWPSEYDQLQIIALNRKVPSGICLQMVLPDCLGKTLIICGPYRQIADEGLKALLDTVSGGEADLALPWRQQRVDAVINQWQSRAFNWLVRYLTGAAYHDLSSTLRVVRREVLEETPLYGDLYRYLPLLARQRGFRVREVPARHAEERGKIGYYGLREYVSRLVDLLAMHFTLHFVRKPLRYFGLRGSLLLLTGFGCISASLIRRLAGTATLGDSPMLMIGLVLFVTGSSLWGVGLLGEILTFTLGRKRKDYIIEKMLE